ncbi:hypothetical protein [Gulosibacter sp. ACHW.36C]|uniref:Lipoprotein n=1 Tax=Gulosibacter sediminis TaxID=1729695 RepID=A0ABY4MW95_9MICO|nr:hypothetical protein [Gulosibacter sediminis]UQN14397.1 hypothetical protein M3M28_10100 [Gulosibacter sediminis]
MLNGNLHPRRSAPFVASSVAVVAAGLLLAGCSTGTTAGNVAAESPTPTEATETAVATEPAETVEPTQTEEPDATATPEATPDGTELPVMINSAFLDAGAGTIEVRGTVTGFIGDGTCTVTAVNADGTELTAESAATPDAQSTICAPITVTGASAGDWQVTLSFEGDGVWGESEPLPAEAG